VQKRGKDWLALTESPPLRAGKVTLKSVRVSGVATVKHEAISTEWRATQLRLPGVFSVVPPVLAIVLSLVFRNAVLSLLGGVLVGAWLLAAFHPLKALARTVDTYLPETFASKERASALLFTLALGGMIGILTKSGSTKALVDRLTHHTRTRRAGLLTAWGGGLVVFFDDYANCLLVGSTLRPLTDRLRISREKLAYILDSTAAPVATVALISTWVGSHCRSGKFGRR
jgi:Na+/H+ antiporter NhaC